MKKRKLRKVKLSKDYIRQKNFKIVKLACCICKRVFRITTTRIEAYTKEVIKKWKCLMCKDKKGKNRRVKL